MRTEAREPLVTDFGTYLKSLRLDKGIPAKTIADGLNLSTQTILNTENNKSANPHPNRIKIWLALIGCSDKYDEAISVLRRVKRRRSIDYILRSPATEHLDRIIDAYESGSLDEFDIDILKCVAVKEYRTPDRRPPAKARKKQTVPDQAYDSTPKPKGRKRTSTSPSKQKQISKTKIGKN